MPRPLRLRQIALVALLLSPAACGPADTEARSALSTRGGHAAELPATRWDHRPEAEVWTRGALDALAEDGEALVATVPADVEAWCPAYPGNGPEARAAFWVGLMSALAKHESTWNPAAVGGGGLWVGLLQIDPRTARGYRCEADSSAELKDGTGNLACAVRIMAHQVPRHGVIAGAPGNWGGVAADWGPMRSAAKRAEMAAWTRTQPYCQPQPEARADLGAALGRLLGGG